jgi:Flp pilus assembly protein TadD
MFLICNVFSAMQAHAQTSTDTPPVTRSLQEDSTVEQARHFVETREFDKAEALLRDYIATNDHAAAAHYMLAYALMRQNKPKESLAAYTQAAKLRTPSPEELRSVADDYVLLNDYADANKWMTRSAEMNGKDAETWYALGRIRYSLQLFQSAVECFEKALSLAPNTVKIEDNLGLAYDGLNRSEDAMRAYRTALAWQQDSSHPSEQPMLNLAIDLIQHNRLDEALPLLNQAVAIAPRDPKIREQLGHLYLQQEQLDKAQQEFQEAVALSPDSSSFHFLLGQVYRRQGKKAEAVAEFARAKALLGDHSTPAKN